MASRPWEPGRRLTWDAVGEWLAAERSGGYRQPAERALLWRARSDADPQDRLYAASVLDEFGWCARLAPPFFQRLTEQGDLHFALEWIEGVSLRRALAAGSPAAALHAGLVLCEAVAALHDAVAPDGTPLHLRATGLDLTTIWIVQGGLRAANPLVESRLHYCGASPSHPAATTLDFDSLAPEIVVGLPREPESDVWAIATVVLAMITGRSPLLRGGMWETLLVIREADVPREDLAAAPPVLRHVLQGALERDPKMRLPGPRELSDALFAAARTDGIEPDARAIEHTARLHEPAVCGLPSAG